MRKISFGFLHGVECGDFYLVGNEPRSRQCPALAVDKRRQHVRGCRNDIWILVFSYDFRESVERVLVILSPGLGSNLRSLAFVCSALLWGVRLD